MGCNNESEYEFAKDFSIANYSNKIHSDLANNYKELKSKCKDEDNCLGLLPAPQTYFKQISSLFGGGKGKEAEFTATKFVSLDALEFLSNVLKNLPYRLLKDSKFRDLVFREFKEIFTLENVICLSYNSVFGTIWRYLCRFREDDRLKVLKDSFSLIITQLPEAQKTVMQAWIDESYDDTEEINAIISKHISQLKDRYASTLDKAENKDATDASVIRYVTLDGIDDSLLPTKKELLTISTSLYGDIIQKVQNIMTHLIIVTKPVTEPAPFDDSINSYAAVPESLGNRRFFSLLSHLVVNGTMFTLKPTLIMCCIAYLSGNVLLKNRAKELLMENKGKWILLHKLTDFPEFISVPFMKLVIRCNKQMLKDTQGIESILTNDELLFYRYLYKIYRIRLSKPKTFSIETGFIPKNINDIRRDYKKQCIKCKEYRSFTLMLKNGECAKCWQKANNSSDLTPEEKHAPIMPEKDDLTKKDVKNYSHLVSCRSCQAIYAVVNVEGLNVGPKCHYCRENTLFNEIPVINCSLCKNRWILNDKYYFGEKDTSKWVCPCCVENSDKALLENVNVSFEQIVDLFPIVLTKLFSIYIEKDNLKLSIKDFFGSMSLYKLYNKYQTTIFAQNVAITGRIEQVFVMAAEEKAKAKTGDKSAPAITTTGKIEEKQDESKENNADEKESELVIAQVIDELTKGNVKYKGRIIHNVKGLVNEIFSAVRHGRLDDICCLCFDTKQLLLLESACGKCENLMCFECLQQWWQQVKPGSIVLPTHLLCAFCKQRPKISTIKKYNKEMCAIVRSDKNKAVLKGDITKDVLKLLEVSYKDYFAWCIKCYQIKEALPRECIRGTIPQINDFVCGECKEKELLSIDKESKKVLEQLTKCPGCDTPTVKVSGCNHISCVCGVHWCYECGKQFDENIIYDHMADEHGGY